MISNQILQNTIEGLKGITRIDFCVMDTDGRGLWQVHLRNRRTTKTRLSPLWSPRQTVRLFRDISSLRFLMSISWNIFFWRMAEADDVYMVGKIAAFQIQNLLVAYKEQF